VVLADAERRNAIDDTFALELEESFHEVERGGGKAVFLTSSGPAFCSGADLKRPRGTQNVATVLSTVANSRVPVIACLDGPAVGAGAALVGVCTFAVMSSSAWIQIPEIAALNKFPSGVVRWMRPCIDLRPLMRLVASGERLGAQRAEEIGWITEGVDASEFEATVRSWRQRVTEMGPEILLEMQRQWVEGRSGQWISQTGR